MTSDQPAAEHAAAPAAEARPEARRLYRRTDGKMIAGVASGLADHLGQRELHVRIAFVVLCLLSGFGAVLYVALWLAIPQQPITTTTAPGLAAADRSDMRRPGIHAPRATDVGVGVIVALVALAAGLGIFATGAGLPAELVWSMLIIGGGVAIVWTQTDVAERRGWALIRGSRAPDNSSAAANGSRRPSLLRIVLGVAVVLVGMGIYVATAVAPADVWRVLAAVAVVLIGIGVIASPWVIRLARQLTNERSERILSQERADVAAHLHDSVLQTLALIQRQADDPRAVVGLARRQERELRAWLYGGGAASDTSLRAGLQRAADEVEAQYGVPVELVAVGDVESDPAIEAVVRAAREALVNAAKHSGAAKIDVYAEVEDGLVSVFVRDRGSGFDLAAVPEDRHGVRGSIIERLRRHGGRAAVETAPGEGTEVRITMPTGPAGPAGPPRNGAAAEDADSEAEPATKHGEDATERTAP